MNTSYKSRSSGPRSSKPPRAFDFAETPKALLFAERCHAGQRRKGPAKLPYIIHPLTMACHALALGLAEDELIATALLHDTCEDCHILPEELPVNATVQEAVRRLSFLPGIRCGT